MLTYWGSLPSRPICGWFVPLQVPYFPPVQSINDFSPAKCLDILHRALGTVNVQIDVKAVKTWTMSAQVAEQFQVRIQPRCITNTPEQHCRDTYDSLCYVALHCWYAVPVACSS